MHATIEGVIHNKNIPRLHGLTIVTHGGFEGGGDGAEVAGQRQSLRHQLAIGVGKGSGKIHVVFEDAGVCRAHDRQGHLVGDGKQGIFK